MSNGARYRNAGYAYLSVIPPVTAVLGFTLHDVNPQIYVPLWLINVGFMLSSLYALTRQPMINRNPDKKQNTAAACLLIAPWMFFSIYAGMGSPPEAYALWVARAYEQQVRYSFLMIGGVLLISGFALVKDMARNRAANLFSVLGFTAIAVAMPLFILNMSYWHSYLPEVFAWSEAHSVDTLPEWHQPVKKMFLAISVVEVSLTYLATAAFAASLRVAGRFTKRGSFIYIGLGLLAGALVAGYGFYPKGVVANGFPFYPFMIPAIPFVMPYYMGLRLLWLENPFSAS